MNTVLSLIKGLHPGKYILRELEKKDINQRQFAISLSEHPQTLNAIIKGSRNLNTNLALKIEQKLGLEEGFLMTLQVHFDIKKIKKNDSDRPNLSNLNKATFWDTKLENIDWRKMKSAVIERVLAYGSPKEIHEIKCFYGDDEVENHEHQNRK